MKFSDMQTDVLDALNAVSTDTMITATQIKRYLNQGKDWCLAYWKWPFLEYKGSDLVDATGNYPYPTLVKTKSATLVRVAGKSYTKIRYEDYLRYFEDESDGEDEVWAEFDRTIYINGNACSIGDAIEIYGTQGVADMSGDNDTSPFSDAEPSGDEAIIKFAIAKGLRKVGGPSADALQMMADAREILERIKDRISENLPMEQTKNKPLLKRLDILNGTIDGSNSSDIGNF